MKIIGVFGCFLLMAAASVRADSFSFRDNYFKNSTIDLSGLSLTRGAHLADWDRQTWTFSAVNEGPLGLLSQMPSAQRPAKPANLRKADKTKAPGVMSFTPIIRPDPKVDYKMAVREPKAGTDYKLKLIPDER